ncbi:CRAL-TRIO domain-containing protein [Trametes elegans]|nr:CRAL-TRIO domain-containing protein [Trametes elegans]
MTDVLETLREQHALLAAAYAENLAAAQALQHTLTEDILPGLVDELGLDEAERARARRWLSDLQSVFRLLRRHKFTTAFALEHARDTLLWRLAVVPGEVPRCPSPLVRCLPLASRDPCGRPVIVVRLARVFAFPGDVREALIHYMELLRLTLEDLNRNSAAGQPGTGGRAAPGPVLQYVALLDVGDISVRDNTDLITWYVCELVPRFPGMLAAVFILNYSWAHSGVWNILRRLLPKSALGRVFFPAPGELLQYLPPDAVPQDYGGALPPLSDPLTQLAAPARISPPPSPPPWPSALTVDETHLAPAARVPSAISPTSHLNPYFGYPVSGPGRGAGGPTPRLRHGRQRKRDLLRTLAALWWARWRHRVCCAAALLGAALAIAAAIASRRRRARGRGWGPGWGRGLLAVGAAARVAGRPVGSGSR